MKNKQYKIKAKVWLYSGTVSAWHFITIDKKESKEIREKYGKTKRGFGSVPVGVTVGNTSWKTSVFPSKEGVYILPIKVIVRRKEGIFDGDTITMILKF